MALRKRKQKKSKKVVYQGSLFGFVKPVGKVPLSAEKIKRIKKFIESKDSKAAVKLLRELREGLESFSNRITNKPTQ